MADMEKLHLLLHPACSTNVLLTNNLLHRIDMQLKFCNLEREKRNLALKMKGKQHSF